MTNDETWNRVVAIVRKAEYDSRNEVLLLERARDIWAADFNSRMFVNTLIMLGLGMVLGALLLILGASS